MPSTPASIAQTAFRRHFSCEPSHTFIAPGRVNIIGEHTDYNDGFVLPCALSFHTAISCRPNATMQMNIIAADYNEERDAFSIEKTIEHSPVHWSNYLRGVVSEFQNLEILFQGLDIVICGSIPQGTGLSSSASLEVCFAMAINEIFNTGLSPKDIAKLCQRAENKFVGCQCGIMDQLISACGEKDKALLIDCRDLSTQTVDIPKHLKLLIINPNVERKLVGSEYNDRRQDCETAAKQLGLSALRDANIDILDAHKDTIQPTVYKRARHIITENERVLAMQQACLRNDGPLIKQLIIDSHASMKDDFEITTPTLDFIADFVNSYDSLACARMTGGGFGGCAVALIPTQEVDQICNALKTAFDDKYKHPLTIYQAEISKGAHVLETY